MAVCSASIQPILITHLHILYTTYAVLPASWPLCIFFKLSKQMTLTISNSDTQHWHRDSVYISHNFLHAGYTWHRDRVSFIILYQIPTGGPTGPPSRRLSDGLVRYKGCQIQYINFAYNAIVAYDTIFKFFSKKLLCHMSRSHMMQGT